MSWFSILLVIFWKPIWYMGNYLYHKFAKKDDIVDIWLENTKNWFLELKKLVYK